MHDTAPMGQAVLLVLPGLDGVPVVGPLVVTPVFPVSVGLVLLRFGDVALVVPLMPGAVVAVPVVPGAVPMPVPVEPPVVGPAGAPPPVEPPAPLDPPAACANAAMGDRINPPAKIAVIQFREDFDCIVLSSLASDG